LLSFGRPDARQFGGVGAMVDDPGLQLTIAPYAHFTVAGALPQRVTKVVERLARVWELPAPPACQITVASAPPEHVGLGTGTQLALAVAAGLNAFLGRPRWEPRSLAVAAGRGERSAIGTYGFAQGGLLFEGGKLPDEAISPLVERVVLPPQWRFVLAILNEQRGLHGEQERCAFGTMPPVPAATSDQLRREALEGLLPAAQRGDFAAFSQSLYRYGYQAGMCFAARQGGPFASARIGQLVEVIRGLGVAGVGQSSWGPTVFALVPDSAAATRLDRDLAAHLIEGDTTIITKPNSTGAAIVCRQP
jgi:beta-RFAP synthase